MPPAGASTDHMATSLDAAVAALDARWRALWLVAVASYGVGDAATTTVGLWTGAGAEAGPLATALVVRYGLAGLFGLKVGSLLVFYLLWRLAPAPARVAVPLALAVVGVAVSVWNGVVLVT